MQGGLTMPYDKYKLQRLGVIDNLLSFNMYPTKEKIKDRIINHRLIKSSVMDISDSSIEKDIFYMKRVLNAPIKYHRGYKGYYYTKPYDYPSVFLDLFIPFVNFDKSIIKHVNRRI